MILLYIAIALVLLLFAILLYKFFWYRKHFLLLKEQIFQQNIIQESKENEYSLKLKHNEEKLTESLQNYQNLITHNENALAALKSEYESKLQKQEQTLQDCHMQHAKDIANLQESYDKKLQESLQTQEKRFQEQNAEKEKVLQGILQTEREKQEALMTQKFYELSNQLLDEKSKQFQEKQDLSLKPLCDEIMRFKNEIAQNTKDHNEKQIALHTEIKHLRDASLQVSKDATNLANAMRGDSKVQGQWGEMILERLLEQSGLEKGREYYTQLNLKDETNQNLRPDVVVHLPHNRFVVIDSKVSLNAYEKFINTESLQKETLIAHIESVRNHVKGLSTKHYQNYIEGGKLDFVIMFMPIERAYNEILREDMNLFLEAYQRGIILSSPSTLMVILRLIHHIWSNEAKDKNLQKILDECNKLIKKFGNFTDSMDKIQRALETARIAYEKADTQIRGRGSMASYLQNIDGYMSKISYLPDTLIQNNQDDRDDDKEMLATIP